ncbi:hypothetical protein AAG906_003056 [Vitis piasezkii]
MVVLLYFEEKVHKKKCNELMPFHLFFHCVDFGASGISIDPRLECKRICREVFTLDRWNNMTIELSSRRPQPARRASPRHIPRVYPLLLLPYQEPLKLLHLIRVIHFS